jgi:hypothetical protein
VPLLALAALVTVLALVPGAAHAQLFLATRPHPPFTIGPLFVRASVTPALNPVRVDVMWSLALPADRTVSEVQQDLYLLWPGSVAGALTGAAADPELARYVEARGFTVVEEGRLPLLARDLSQAGRGRPPDPVPGGAPFVTFVRQGGALGLTAPVTYVRIPWRPRLADRTTLLDLRMSLPSLVKPKKASWVENAFWGPRQRLSITFNDVRSRAMFPMYLEHRDRVVRLAEDPSQLIVNFADADHLKIEEFFPPTASRRMSESLESTEVVSLYLDRSEGFTPQVLTVQFGYFTAWQAWTPILIPALFFLLGNLAGPLLVRLAMRVGRVLSAKVHLGRPGEAPPVRESGVILSRDTLGRIVPGETTYEDVVRLCGPPPEEQEQTASPDRRVLLYRGRRVVPQRRRTFGWLATVDHWDVEQHEVEIDLEGDRVRDVQARVRRARLAHPEPA